MTRWCASIVLAALAVCTTAIGAEQKVLPSQTAQPLKVLRYAFRIAETGFDPAQVNDIYSRTITPHIFEGLYQYDHLARPAKIKPLTAAAMPEVSADYKVWTVRIQPGIYFAADPAFKGPNANGRRELVAQDYAYTFKRFADPKLKSPVWTTLEQSEILGLAELRKQAMDSKQPFDYDRPIEGLQVLDRYTLQFRLGKPEPRFIQTLATGDLFGAVAREVAESYGDNIAAHPVGTGPFKLKQWRRSSLIVLERNPDYRRVEYHAEPAADDAEGQALLARFKGRTLPMVDRVEISIIEEEQPRWLSFLNGEHDAMIELPFDFINQIMPNGKVAPNLAKRGIQGYRILRPENSSILFNMDHPVVGGLEPGKIALRRALGLALDIQREIQLVWRGQAIPSQSVLMPHTTGYDPKFKSEMSEYDPARAKALLDLHGYVDRDGDGWREQPDGSPLLLEMNTQPDGLSRQIDDVRKKSFDAIGVRMVLKPAKFPENLKAARAGAYMMWRVGAAAAAPDGHQSLARYHSKQIGGQNMARFRLPAFDAIYERMDEIPDGPEREALFLEAKKLAVAYMPYKANYHRFMSDMAHPWLIGYRRPLFWQEWWHFVDIDTTKLPK